MTRHWEILQACGVARKKMADMRKTYVLFKFWLESLVDVWVRKKPTFVV